MAISRRRWQKRAAQERKAMLAFGCFMLLSGASRSEPLLDIFPGGFFGEEALRFPPEVVGDAQGL
jgi:hypothetical protein